MNPTVQIVQRCRLVQFMMHLVVQKKTNFRF